MADGARARLLPGEQILWEGVPYTGLVFRPIDGLLIPFSLLWSGFAVFWNAGVWTGGAPLFFKLWGLPFLVAGLYFTVGRFFADIISRKYLTYYVTNKRVLIEKGRTSSIRSLDIFRLPVVEVEERRDGSGNIRFGTTNGWFAGNNFGIWQPTWDAAPQFIRIPNVRFVYELIHKQPGN